MQSSKAGAPDASGSIVAGLSCVALALAAIGCADSAASKEPEIEDSPRVWVGEVADSDVRVGLARDGERTNLFFCGGAASFAENTRWFSGDALPSDAISFTQNGWNVDVIVEGDSVVGTVEPEDGTELSWVAREIALDTNAGLYEGDAPCGKLGLIVTQASADDEPSGQGACMRVDGESLIVEQVNPVFERIADSEIPVTVASLPDEEFTVRPVVAAEQ